MMKRKIIAALESIKPYEARIPLHPEHFKKIHDDNHRLVFQKGYAHRFGQQDTVIKDLGFSVFPRDELLPIADVIFLLKPMISDLEKMKKGAVVIGWCHAVQQTDVADIAQKRGLTLIAMENMYAYKNKKREHLFHFNNFSAGMLGIEHALNFTPYQYQQEAKVSIISYGAVSQGATSKLAHKGFSNITVFSQRSPRIINNKLSGVSYEKVISKGSALFTSDGSELKDHLLSSDIIVNGIMQDVLNPQLFLSREDLIGFQNKFIIDLSCDDLMGFDFAHSTSFDQPIFKMANNFYYAVDHIPTLDFQTVSVHLSEQLLPILNGFLRGQFNKNLHDTLMNATEIQDGKIINPIITAYQKKLPQRSSLNNCLTDEVNETSNNDHNKT